MLIGVSLAEAAGERRPQNMPGTVDEYPNWRIPLSGADGQPVMLEDLPAHAGVRAVADAVSGALRRSRARGALQRRLAGHPSANELAVTATGCRPR